MRCKETTGQQKGFFAQLVAGGGGVFASAARKREGFLEKKKRTAVPFEKKGGKRARDSEVSPSGLALLREWVGRGEKGGGGKKGGGGAPLSYSEREGKKGGKKEAALKDQVTAFAIVSGRKGKEGKEKGPYHAVREKG